MVGAAVVVVVVVATVVDVVVVVVADESDPKTPHALTSSNTGKHFHMSLMAHPP